MAHACWTLRFFFTALVFALLFLEGVAAVECGQPAFSLNEPAAIYLWQECGDDTWKLQAFGGDDYANFKGRLYTDGEFETVTGIKLGAADTLVSNAKTIQFDLWIWNENSDGIDFRTINNARVYLDIENSDQRTVYLGPNKIQPSRFPLKLGGEGQQYNIVFVFTDDQRFDTLWAMPIVNQELVQKGVNFTNAIVTSPLCCPARASLLSGGLYDKNTGVYTNKLPSGTFDLFYDTENLGTALQQTGYRTGLIGKVMNGYPEGYIMPGWDYLVANLGPARDDWYSFNVTIGSSDSQSAVGQIVGPITEYVTDYQKDRALEFIQTSGDQPFFLMLSTYAPHAPASASAADKAPFFDYVYEGRGFTETDLLDKPSWVWDPTRGLSSKQPLPGFPAQQLASLQAVDRAVGDIIDELATNGQLQNTVIVYSSDNGFMWGEHGIWKKTHEFEESLRVPLVIRFPDSSFRVDSRQVATDIDLPSLFLDIANSDFHTDGESLMPLLLDDGGNWREWLLINLYSHDSKRSWAGLRSPEWKYTENIGGDSMLYNLFSDPFELENLSGLPDFSAIESTFKEKLDKEKGLTITSIRIPNPSLNQYYNEQLTVWGGTPPYSWSVIERPVNISLGRDKLPLGNVHFPFRLDIDIDACGAPTIQLDNVSRFYVWRNCTANDWHLRATADGSYGRFSGHITASEPMLAASPYGLGAADNFDHSDINSISFIFRIWNNGLDGIDFSLAENSNMLLDVTGEQNSIISLGANAFEISQDNWPLTLNDPIACGEPSYDLMQDQGVFIWKTCDDGIWHLRVLGGGDYQEISGAVRATGPVNLLNSYSLTNDKVEVQNDSITFSIQVWGNLANGFDFTFDDGVEAVIDIDTHQLPFGLELDANTGQIHGTPTRAVKRNVWIQAQDQSTRKADGQPQAFTVDYDFDIQ